MEDVVSSGDSALLEKRIIAIHRLKTAVPAGTLARMGCVVGGGSAVQIEAVGMFFEAIGVRVSSVPVLLGSIYEKTKKGAMCGVLFSRLRPWVYALYCQLCEEVWCFVIACGERGFLVQIEEVGLFFEAIGDRFLSSSYLLQVK
jgi:hypothetical protein